MSNETIRARVAAAIGILGLNETSKRLGTANETTLRVATPGVRVQRGTEALVSANLHRLSEPPPSTGCAV